MVTAFSSPEMIAQKAHVPDITPDPTAPAPPRDQPVRWRRRTC
jgi:hypothetical protein